MKRIFSFCLLALCAICGVRAESLNSQLSTLTLIENDSVAIEQINIVANRATKTTPIAHTNLSRQEIEERNYGEDIPSLLANLPSVVISSESGTGIGSTSFRVRGTDPTRINVTLNGVPMNDAETHSVYWYDTPDPPTFDLTKQGRPQASIICCSSKSLAFFNKIDLAVLMPN